MLVYFCTIPKEDHLGDELAKMDSFFEYANRKNCFRNNKIYDIKMLQIAGKKIQCCLLNSAPFSTLKPNDKEVHFLPKSAQDALRRREDADFMITLMHHTHEWCDWDTKEMLKTVLPDNDLVFYGHEHKPEGIIITDEIGNNSNIIMGGRFDVNSPKECTFNAVLFDSESAQMKNFRFDWNNKKGIFKRKENKPMLWHRNPDIPTEEYLKELLTDNAMLAPCLKDYYVMPKLEVEGELFADHQPEQINANDIFDELIKAKIIGITGASGGGKTSLLRFLYNESIKYGFHPLYIEQKYYRDGRIEKMFEEMYELQYGNGHDGFESFMQKDLCKRIIFVDDLDLIKSTKARNKLAEYVISSGGLMIYTTKERIQQDLVELVKERIQVNGSGALYISPFYKERRDQLVDRICKLEKINQPEKIPHIITALDYLAQSQAGYLSLTPVHLIQYITFFAKDNSEDKGHKTFTLVFETNIRSAMIENAKGNVNLYLTALEYLAHEMYFSMRRESVTLEELQKIIDEYNAKYRASVNAKDFKETCVRAQIMVEKEDAFEVSFRESNIFAYFVAKYINRALEKNSAKLNDISYVMNHICFGINDTIILFLSYIRSNTHIILNIASKAAELLEQYPEIDFDQNNLPNLMKTTKKSDLTPSHEDKKEAAARVEMLEREKQEQQERIEFRNIFDFDEEDVDKGTYRIIRALRYVRLIGRMLVDQYGSLDGDELDVMVNAIYSVPQKIAYAVLQPYDEHFDELIEDLSQFVQEYASDEKISKETLQNMLSSAAVTHMLNIFNDIAYNASNMYTINVLNEAMGKDGFSEGRRTKSNYKIYNLMLQENAGSSQAFVSKAIDLNKEYSRNPFIHQLIARIAQKHLIYTPRIGQRITEQLVSGGVLSAKNQKTALISQYRINKEYK